MIDPAPQRVAERPTGPSLPMPRRTLLLALVADLAFVGALAAYTLTGPFSTLRVVGVGLASVAVVLLNVLLPRPIRHRTATFWVLLALLGAGTALAGRGPAGAGFGLSKRQACARLDAIDAEMRAALGAGVTPGAVQQMQHVAAELRSLRAKTLLPSVRRELTFQVDWADSIVRALQQPNATPMMDLDAARALLLEGSSLLHQPNGIPTKNVCSAR